MYGDHFLGVSQSYLPLFRKRLLLLGQIERFMSNVNIRSSGKTSLGNIRDGCKGEVHPIHNLY